MLVSYYIPYLKPSDLHLLHPVPPPCENEVRFRSTCFFRTNVISLSYLYRKSGEVDERQRIGELHDKIE